MLAYAAKWYKWRMRKGRVKGTMAWLSPWPEVSTLQLDIHAKSNRIRAIKKRIFQIKIRT